MALQRLRGAGRLDFEAAQDLGVHAGPPPLQLLECILVDQRLVHVEAQLPVEGVQEIVLRQAADLGMKLSVKGDGLVCSGRGIRLGLESPHPPDDRMQPFP
jgi:hypothetical protein